MGSPDRRVENSGTGRTSWTVGPSRSGDSRCRGTSTSNSCPGSTATSHPCRSGTSSSTGSPRREPTTHALRPDHRGPLSPSGRPCSVPCLTQKVTAPGGGGERGDDLPPGPAGSCRPGTRGPSSGKETELRTTASRTRYGNYTPPSQPLRGGEGNSAYVLSGRVGGHGTSWARRGGTCPAGDLVVSKTPCPLHARGVNSRIFSKRTPKRNNLPSDSGPPSPPSRSKARGSGVPEGNKRKISSPLSAPQLPVSGTPSKDQDRCRRVGVSPGSLLSTLDGLPARVGVGPTGGVIPRSPTPAHVPGRRPS